MTMLAWLDPPWLDDLLWTYQNLIHDLGINGLLALSMYVVLAVGQLSLGQAAFMGLGAYSSALMTLKLGWPFWLVLPASVVAPVAFALAIGLPTLRLAGVYLAIATIGLGEVPARGLPERRPVRRRAGPVRHPGKRRDLDDLRPARRRDRGAVAGRAQRLGRAMEAMREDETAAAVMGVNLMRYKMGALLASAVLAGIAGCLNAHVSDFIGPGEYGFEPAVTILSYALLGGHRHADRVRPGRRHPDPAAGTAAQLQRPAPGAERRHHRDRRAVPALRHPALAPAPARRMTTLLELVGLTRRYAGLVAVDSVDMRVAAGGIHAVIGPNGAGKTTLFNLVSGITAPSSGRILLDGHGRDAAVGASPRPPGRRPAPSRTSASSAR